MILTTLLSPFKTSTKGRRGLSIKISFLMYSGCFVAVQCQFVCGWCAIVMITWLICECIDPLLVQGHGGTLLILACRVAASLQSVVGLLTFSVELYPVALLHQCSQWLSY